ncbi:hypothetical protein Bca4012_048573 [Brassica carinata]|uniref:Legume lectin domain-containing protein n=1 Tax=Brassica carinata TaxID=52824 RepID=A0A8X7R851_BRACI|nr:hypothetical protein Bca52824_051519 [Brassica carinata]
MSRVVGSHCMIWMIISVHVILLVLAQDGDQFEMYYFRGGNLHLDGMANTNDGPMHLTNNTVISTGHAMLKTPINFTASSPSSFTFSTEFVFAIFPLQKPPSYGQGMSFVVAPKIDLRANGTETSGLGLFNSENNNKTENHILAVELDTNQSPEAHDESDNHVGIDINSIVSVAYANASYYSKGKIKPLLLASGDRILVWIDYDGVEKLLNVTLAQVPKSTPVSPFLSSSIKPSVPLLSRSINLSEIFNETMFVGFSGSTGSTRSNQYVLAWSFKKGGKAQSLDISKIMDAPDQNSGS